MDLSCTACGMSPMSISSQTPAKTLANASWKAMAFPASTFLRASNLMEFEMFLPVLIFLILEIVSIIKVSYYGTSIYIYIYIYIYMIAISSS